MPEITAVTPLPKAPSRQSSAGTFAAEADAFLSALPAFGDQMNVMAAQVQAANQSAGQSEDAAASSAETAEAAKASATSEVIRARAFAANAAASATAAESAQGSLGNLALIQAMSLLF